MRDTAKTFSAGPGSGRGSRRQGAIAAALLALCATFALAASPAYATTGHVFDPVLSLTGDCSTSALDEVPDPGLCPGTVGVDHPPKKFDNPCGVATDPHGDIYVASAALGKTGTGTGGRIDVFDPEGKYLSEIKDEKQPCDLAVDSEGNVYVLEYAGKDVALFEPKTYPPIPGSEYGPRIRVVGEGDIEGSNLCAAYPRAIAIDPSNDRLWVNLRCKIAEFDSATDGSALITGSIGTDLGYTFYGIAVLGRNHDIYAPGATSQLYAEYSDPANQRVFVLDSTDGHLKAAYDGADTPAGNFGWFANNAVGIALDQASGDPYLVRGQDTNAIEQLDAAGHYIGELEKPLVGGGTGIRGLAVDGPCRKGSELSEPCRLDEAYDSPNAGHVFVTSGSSAANSRLYAFAPVITSLPEFPLTVARAGTGSGTVTSEPAGINCAVECTAEYEEGTEVTLTATADEGSTFAGWSGGGCSGAGACEVTMSEAKEVTAEFAEVAFHTLTLTLTGNGSVSASEGTISGCTSAGGPSCEGEYEEGAHVLLTETPGAQSRFAGWGTLQCDESTATTCEVELNGDEGVVASFVNTVPLTVTTEGTGTVTSEPAGISCAPFCSAEFDEGALITLTATAAPEYTFLSWKGCDTGGVEGRKCKVMMSKAKTVKATFAKTYALTFSKAAGTGMGKVSSSPAGISCAPACTTTTAAFKEGTKVTLKPTASVGSTFTEWTGACSGSGACEVTMGEDQAAEAKFTAIPKFSLTVNKTGGGQGTVKSTPASINCGLTCSTQTSSFEEGKEVELTASVALGKGSSFGGWSGGGGTCAGLTNPCKMPAIAGTQSVTAEFK